MSNYIHVLRRLEEERQLPEAIPTPAAAAPARITPLVLDAVPDPEVAIPTAPPTDTRRARAQAPRPHPGIATLLDNIRVLATGRTSRVVVFCGASNAEAVAGLAEDLVVHAAGIGLHAFAATLTRTTEGPIVTPSRTSLANAPALVIDLDAATTATVDVYTWVQRIAPDNDLVVITGPPLATSIDAALLACACDGLVIVAESEVTERSALQIAAERARIAGCRTLGVVMHGAKVRMPNWIRRLTGEPRETPLAREDSTR